MFELENIGRFLPKPNVRNKNIIVRWKGDYFEVSYPACASLVDLKKELLKMSEGLLDLKNTTLQTKSGFTLNIGDVFETLTFKVKIQTTSLSKGYYSFKDGKLQIIIPEVEDVTSERIQNVIRRVVEDICRFEAKWFLEYKLETFAKMYNFKFKSLKINSSRGRWGSCSSVKNINLSLYCMMLPEHLVDLIILHELCHTREMNHGPIFWQHLDSVTNGKAQELTKELKTYNFQWYK